MPLSQLTARAVLGASGLVASWGLFAADDIPGWTELGSVAKGSVIAALLSIIGGVVFWLIRIINSQRKDLMNEIKDSRKEYGRVVDSVRQTIGDVQKQQHDDSTKLNETLRLMTENCAKVNAKIED